MEYSRFNNLVLIGGTEGHRHYDNVTTDFIADESPDKVNLGSDMYLDENEQVPILPVVEKVFCWTRGVTEYCTKNEIGKGVNCP
jgi:hypothetical protein